MYTLKINFVQLINIVRITVQHFNLHIHEYSFERLRRRRKWGKKKIRPPIWTSYPIPLNSVRCNVDATLRRNLLIGWTSCERDHEKAINEEEGRSSFNFGLRAYENEARQEAASLDNI